MPIERQDPKDTRIYITIDKLNEVIDWCNNWENQWDMQEVQVPSPNPTTPDESSDPGASESGAESDHPGNSR